MFHFWNIFNLFFEFIEIKSHSIMQKNLLSSVEILKNLNENNFENFDFLFLGSEIIQSRFAIELQ